MNSFFLFFLEEIEESRRLKRISRLSVKRDNAMVKQCFTCVTERRARSRWEANSPRGTTTTLMRRHNIYRVVSLLPCSKLRGWGGTVVCSLRTDRTVSSKYVDKKIKNKDTKLLRQYQNFKYDNGDNAIMHS